MATKKTFLNREQYDNLIANCKSKIRTFLLETPYTSLQYVPCDYDPEREFYVLNVPTMGDIEFRFNSFESDRASDNSGVKVIGLPIIFKEYRNPTPFKACGLSFNEINGKCPLLAFADDYDKILTGLDKVLSIANNVASQPFYWLVEGAKVWWDDPEDITSGRYEVVEIPDEDDIPRSEWTDDMVILISDGTSDAEVTISEITPYIEM